MSTTDEQDKSKREKLREMATNDDLEATALYRVMYRRRYGEEP